MKKQILTINRFYLITQNKPLKEQDCARAEQFLSYNTEPFVDEEATGLCGLEKNCGI